MNEISEFELIQQLDTCDRMASSVNNALASFSDLDPIGGKQYYTFIGYLNLALAELAEYVAHVQDKREELLGGE